MSVTRVKGEVRYHWFKIEGRLGLPWQQGTNTKKVLNQCNTSDTAHQPIKSTREYYHQEEQKQTVSTPAQELAVPGDLTTKMVTHRNSFAHTCTVDH